MGLGEMPLGTGRVLADLSQTVWFPCQKAHHPIQAKKSNLGSSQWETKPSAEALPSKLAKLNFVPNIPKQTIPIHGPRTKRPCFINRTADESRVPNFPGWTHLINSPSANECRKDYSLSHPPHQNQNKGMSLRILQTEGKAMSQSCRKWLQWYIRLSLQW